MSISFINVLLMESRKKILAHLHAHFLTSTYTPNLNSDQWPWSCRHCPYLAQWGIFQSREQVDTSQGRRFSRLAHKQGSGWATRHINQSDVFTQACTGTGQPAARAPCPLSYWLRRYFDAWFRGAFGTGQLTLIQGLAGETSGAFWFHRYHASGMRSTAGESGALKEILVGSRMNVQWHVQFRTSVTAVFSCHVSTIRFFFLCDIYALIFLKLKKDF